MEYLSGPILSVHMSESSLLLPWPDFDWVFPVLQDAFHHLLHTTWHFSNLAHVYPEEGASIFLQNVCTHLTD